MILLNLAGMKQLARLIGVVLTCGALTGAFAALAVAAFLVEMHPAMRKTTSAPIVMRQPAPGPPPAEALPDNLPLTIRPAIERKALKPRPSPRAQVASIRIETPDPDVIILLVGN